MIELYLVKENIIFYPKHILREEMYHQNDSLSSSRIPPYQNLLQIENFTIFDVLYKIGRYLVEENEENLQSLDNHMIR